MENLLDRLWRDQNQERKDWTSYQSKNEAGARLHLLRTSCNLKLHGRVDSSQNKADHPKKDGNVLTYLDSHLRCVLIEKLEGLMLPTTGRIAARWVALSGDTPRWVCARVHELCGVYVIPFKWIQIWLVFMWLISVCCSVMAPCFLLGLMPFILFVQVSLVSVLFSLLYFDFDNSIAAGMTLCKKTTFTDQTAKVSPLKQN